MDQLERPSQPVRQLKRKEVKKELAQDNLGYGARRLLRVAFSDAHEAREDVGRLKSANISNLRACPYSKTSPIFPSSSKL